MLKSKDIYDFFNLYISLVGIKQFRQKGLKTKEMKKANNKVWAIIGVALVVAVVASAISAVITSNVISVMSVGRYASGNQRAYSR